MNREPRNDHSKSLARTIAEADGNPRQHSSSHMFGQQLECHLSHPSLGLLDGRGHQYMSLEKGLTGKPFAHAMNSYSLFSSIASLASLTLISKSITNWISHSRRETRHVLDRAPGDHRQ
jgi:hypothetical protein